MLSRSWSWRMRLLSMTLTDGRVTGPLIENQRKTRRQYHRLCLPRLSFGNLLENVYYDRLSSFWRKRIGKGLNGALLPSLDRHVQRSHSIRASLNCNCHLRCIIRPMAGANDRNHLKADLR